MRSSTSFSFRSAVLVLAASALGASALVACVKKDPPSAADAEPASVGTGPVALPAPALATGKDAGKPDGAAPAIAAADKAKLLAELKSGRASAVASKWQDARGAYTRALAIDPGNATVLAELSWADVNLDDFGAAIEHGELALRTAGDAKLRAQILYNVGRAYEGKGEPMEAAVRYRSSIEKRPNAVVQKRLDGLLARAKAGMLPDASVLPPKNAFCARRFAEDLALFQCLERVEDEVFLKSSLVAAREPVTGLPPPFGIVRFGNEGIGLTVHLLVRSTSQNAVEPVAELGRAWNPGAFGVHEDYTFTSAKESVFGKRHVVEVHGRHEHGDADYAGLSVSTETLELATVCAYEGDEPMKCIGPLVVASTETQTYPIDPKDLSAEDKALVLVLKKEKPVSAISAKADIALAADGVTITAVSGPKVLLPNLGKFSFP